ncbi:hypothetical protein HAZT_HAZT008156 [Hyalella azteca]|uniref:Ig-like domain-containing protein n=1 Tax=Hyalella azteca TaxID=294128 RepID=A0A6A0H935_HYAAZ|nr:hypothetical protein HAZT_HAZT008156 [Hyalella azteca]
MAGKDVQVGCYVPDGDTPLTIRWQFHGKEVSHTMGVSTTKLGARSNILTIESATHGHSGNYTCVASNPAGESRHVASLTVHGRNIASNVSSLPGSTLINLHTFCSQFPSFYSHLHSTTVSLLPTLTYPRSILSYPRKHLTRRSPSTPVAEVPVLFPMSFNSDRHLEGEMAQINCVVQKGDSPLLLSWLYNGQPLTPSDHTKVLEVGRSSILTIDPVKGHHQGNYTCVAANPAGEMAVHAQLFVNGTLWYWVTSPYLAEPPVVSPIGFNLPQYLEDDMAQTNCVVQKGDQPLILSWLYNGQRLTPSDHTKVLEVGRSSILTIDPVKGHHQGNYTCVASNPAGEMAVHAQLFVNGTCYFSSLLTFLDLVTSEPPVVSPIAFNLPQYLEDDMAQGNCVVHKGDHPIMISWLFNGQPVTISDEVQIMAMGQRSSILTIDPVKGHHQGNYTCVAANHAGAMAVHEQLYVNEPPVVSPIGFNLEYLEGDLAQTNCVVQKGDNPVLISWLFNGLPLVSSDHVEIAGMGKKTSILTIDPVMGDHRGNYSCVASNPAGQMAVHAILHMELIFFFGLNSNPRLAEPPVVSRIGFDPEYLEGDMAQTNCVVQKGDSPLLISWQFNGLPLTNSDHVEIAGMGKRSSILTIDPVMGDHRGNYTCVASNPAGEMAVHAILHVNGAPLCLLLLYDEVQINAMGQRSSILTIDPVKGHHQGNYSCVAANPAGQMAVHMALAVNGTPFLEGEVAQSNCVLTSGDKPVVISWLFNGRPLHSTDDVQIDKVGGRTSILTIDPVRGHHQGNYTCVASNHAGQMAVDTTMVVNEPPLLLPIHLESDRFLEGDFAQLNCVLRSGDRPVTTTWLFNGRPLVPSDDVHVTKMGQRSSILTIDPVRGHNQGNYTCVATNQAGEAAVHTRLEVQGKQRGTGG